MKKWYTLQTKPHSEYKVKHWLQRQAIITFLPELSRDISDSLHKRLPLFPCYLFMKIDMDSVSSSQWMWTPGLRRIVTVGEQPAVVPQQAIDLIKTKLENGRANSPITHRLFNAGETVRIKSGPMSGMLAIFQKPLPSEKRVRILLDFLGQMNRVNIEVEALEKVPNHIRAAKSRNGRRTRGRGRRISKAILDNNQHI